MLRTLDSASRPRPFVFRWFDGMNAGLVVRGSLASALLLAAACGTPSSEPAECTLPEDDRFRLTDVELDTSRSNRACPEFVASEWDTRALIDQGLCEREIVDCVVELTCIYDGFEVYGRFGDRQGRVVGRLEVESPFACIYAAEGEWGVQSSDAGE